VHRILVRKLEKCLIGKQGRRWDGNIKGDGLSGLGIDGTGCRPSLIVGFDVSFEPLSSPTAVLLTI
jgi:hypothetical protein